MPIDTVKSFIHIRRKRNQLVFDNINRLNHLATTAKTPQDLLDGLHPWKSPIYLIFENKLPLLLSFCGALIALLFFIQPSHIGFQLCFPTGLLIIFFAYISHEPEEPVHQAISLLENTMMAKKYDLHPNQLPQYLDLNISPAQFMIRLKQMFPMFNLGTVANEILHYSSTIWSDEYQKQYPVVVFTYRYIYELTIKDKDGNTIRLKEVEKYLWGVFVFDISLTTGLAISSNHKEFNDPYIYPWQSSDIQTNQRINIFGCHPLEMAKVLTPSFNLKLVRFFEKQNGDLVIHPQNNILCFLSTTDLFKIKSSVKDIQDISTLRGHLRTLKLPYLEKLKEDLTRFLK